MSSDYKSWRQSSHAKVNCQFCHTPGLADFLTHKLLAVKEVYLHLTGFYKNPINQASKLSKKMKDEGCLKCHSSLRKITPKKGLKIDHEKHRENNINCTTCHNRVAHPGLAGYTSFISMVGCTRCHKLTKTARASGRCNICHTKDFDLVPDSHKTTDWQIPTHGKIAKNNRKQCKACHLNTFCQNCHGLDMPHPKGNWVKGEKLHLKIGKERPRLCQKCHRELDFCSACHHEGYQENRGPWRLQHPSRVREAGASSCFKCHGPTYCAYCHVRGVKYGNIRGP
jgi:hypothetical protein